jgi:hypothetical protein
MLFEAAFCAAKIPGPLRAFFMRVRARRGTQIATIATAGKLACLCWTMIERGEDYSFARPTVTDKKLRALELRAGMSLSAGAGLLVKQVSDVAHDAEAVLVVVGPRSGRTPAICRTWASRGARPRPRP